ncbi:DUF4349 domain-containing protein [Aeoliella sp. SH292]|uniref:DUF4349 domain-containing protein n=1 Tax=Aeoliella sp. SH292 TaxID=3454464 RepID=UPI003F99E3A1
MNRALSLLLALLLVVGCGVESEYEAATVMPAPAPASPASDMNYVYALKSENSAGQAASETPPVADNRKIIYTASLAVVVEDFSGVEQSINELVKKYGGFVASANVSLNQGSERSGTWVLRVPVATFEDFLNASGNLGVPERREQNGQDVTEEYVDLEARIRSKKQLEERILELLADNKGEIKDVIEVERELSRVRTEIEQMEGRLRYLADRTELTTVTLMVREEKEYQPPQAPGLGSQIAATWNNSTTGIWSLGKGIVLVAVAALPWLLLVGVVVGPVWAWRKRSE